MTLAYFDCFGGAGGDMIVGSLLDAGADLQTLTGELAKLGAPACDIGAQRVNRGGITGTKFTVEADPADQPHRRLDDILSMIDGADIAARARDRAKKVFNRLAQAEAKVHDIDVGDIHFHEVGAIDSIMDIVGACVALDLLDVDKIICSPIPLGDGTIRCDHGILPVPSPATAQLLIGAKTTQSELRGEVTTPTAAALLTTLAQSYGPPPEMRIDAVGYGAGTRTDGQLPNLLRVYIGSDHHEATADTVVELSANIDDCTGELVGATIEKLISAGCVDAWATPIVMKKSRPGLAISALCSIGDVEAVERIIFSETTTFGIRRRLCRRSRLARQIETVETAFGPVRIKIGRLGSQEMTAAAEFEDCLRAARSHHVPVKEVLDAAEATYRLRKDT